MVHSAEVTKYPSTARPGQGSFFQQISCWPLLATSSCKETWRQEEQAAASPAGGGGGNLGRGVCAENLGLFNKVTGNRHCLGEQDHHRISRGPSWAAGTDHAITSAVSTTGATGKTSSQTTSHIESTKTGIIPGWILCPEKVSRKC